MTSIATASDLAEGRIVSINDEIVVLGIPGTDYRLHLKPRGGPGASPIGAGQRVTGRIEARGLRMWTARAGGRFIEPVDGPPRIIAGVVRAADAAANRILVDAAVPIWVELKAPQNATAFAPGELINGYVHSGATFAPARGR
jgi:hypothetical protein